MFLALGWPRENARLAMDVLDAKDHISSNNKY